MRQPLFLLLMISTLIGHAWSQEMRVAHVDSRVIFTKYKGSQLIQDQYDQKLARWEQEANLLQKEVASIREKLDKQSLLLSEEKKQKLEGDLAEKEATLRAFVDRIYGMNGELVAENQKISAPLVQEIRNAVNEVALQEGYDLVVDRATGSVLFWKAEHDLTQRVLDELNSK